jgi:hypothetical protein
MIKYEIEPIYMITLFENFISNFTMYYNPLKSIALPTVLLGY